jgi:hypothetical protein
MARKGKGDGENQRLILRVRAGDEWAPAYSSVRSHARTCEATVWTVDDSGELAGTSYHGEWDGLRFTCYQSTDYIPGPTAEASSQWDAEYQESGPVNLRRAQLMAATLGKIARAIEREHERTGDYAADWGEHLLIVARALGADSMAFPADRYSSGREYMLPLAKGPARVRAMLAEWRAAERRAKWEADFPVRSCVDCGTLTESRAGDESPRCQPCREKKSQLDHAAWLANYNAKQAEKQAAEVAAE